MQTSRALTDEQLVQFDESGYLVLPAWLDADEMAALKADVDRLEGDAAGGRANRHPYQYEAIGALTWHPRTLDAVETLMATWRPRAPYGFESGRLPPYIGEASGSGRCLFHHIHAYCQQPGTPGVSWHQDYEQHPQTNRSHLMVHVFFYLNGLDGTVGDLMLLPGTQRSVMDRLALYFMGDAELPGSIAVNDVPPGSAVIVHSAVLHGRRAKPGGDRPRYFIDSSYCQSGVLWPSYGDRSMWGMYDELRARHVAAGGTRDWLYDTSQFFPAPQESDVRRALRGSVITKLLDGTD